MRLCRVFVGYVGGLIFILREWGIIKVFLVESEGIRCVFGKRDMDFIEKESDREKSARGEVI